MTILEALAKGTDILNRAGIEAPGVDAGVMLCHVTGGDRAYLYAHGEDYLDFEHLEKYTYFLSKRCSGMPVQYITGKQEFMALDFHVAPGVLIPRQETETLVEAVIGLERKHGMGLKILDIGTGSGCIAVSLAYHIRNSFVVAVDISQKALDISRLNAMNNGVAGRMEFIRSDLFDDIEMTGFDVIVSNPPYIRVAEINGLQREVRDFEPLRALDGGEDGLLFYRRITGTAPGFLKENGILAFEVGINQAGEVAKLMEHRFKEISVIKDLAGVERVVTGIY